MVLAFGLDHLLRMSARLGWIACVVLFLVLGAISTRLVVVHVLIPPPRLQVVRVQLQLVICSDDGHECQRDSGHGPRATCQPHHLACKALLDQDVVFE